MDGVEEFLSRSDLQQRKTLFSLFSPVQWPNPYLCPAVLICGQFIGIRGPVRLVEAPARRAKRGISQSPSSIRHSRDGVAAVRVAASEVAFVSHA
jgi:hypothetical protein